MKKNNYINHRVYKIETWDSTTNNWLFIRNFDTYKEALEKYNLLLKNFTGVYRLIKVLECDIVGDDK